MNKDHTFNPAGQPAGQPASKPRGDGPGFDAGMSRINVPGMEGVVAPGSIPGALDQAVVDRLFQMGISTPQRPIDHLVRGSVGRVPAPGWEMRFGCRRLAAREIPSRALHAVVSTSVRSTTSKNAAK